MDALPKLADAASSPELRQPFQSHLEETRGQVQRLEQAFELLDREARRASCEAMKGVVKEGKEMIEAKETEMSNQTTKANQGNTYRCKECEMELQITKGCDCDECKTELQCCGQPLVRVNPQVQNA